MAGSSPFSRPAFWVILVLALIGAILAFRFVPAFIHGFDDDYVDEPPPGYGADFESRRDSAPTGAPAATAATSPEAALVVVIAMIDSFFPEGDVSAPGPLAELLEEAQLGGLPADLRAEWDAFLALRRRIEANDVEVLDSARAALTSLRERAQRRLDALTEP